MNRNRKGGHTKKDGAPHETPYSQDEKDKKNNIYWLDEVLVIKLGLYFFLEKSKCQKEGQNSNRLLSVDL